MGNSWTAVWRCVGIWVALPLLWQCLFTAGIRRWGFSLQPGIYQWDLWWLHNLRALHNAITVFEIWDRIQFRSSSAMRVLFINIKALDMAKTARRKPFRNKIMTMKKKFHESKENTEYRLALGCKDKTKKKTHFLFFCHWNLWGRRITHHAQLVAQWGPTVVVPIRKLWHGSSQRNI